MSVPDVSICFVNWRTPDDLIACVRSIGACSPTCSYDLWVIENGSGDDSEQRLRQALPEAQLIVNKENCGFGRAASMAIEQSRGRHVLLLNPDMEARPGGVEALLAFMEENPRAGACGGALLSTDGERHHSCRRFPSAGAALVRGTPLEALLPRSRAVRDYLMEDIDPTAPIAVDWLSGACLMLRREAIDEVGAFDPQFFMYLEDTDLCLRMCRAGWSVHYVPNAEFIHVIGKSSDLAQPRMIREHHKSMYRYFRKHMGRGWRAILRPAAWCAIAARCLLVLLKNRLMWWRTMRVTGSNKT